ncbi:hypothetical protein OQA88_4187 [Cercophora sp. LCS_1]
MAQSPDHLSDLDRHVQLLEGKVNQLRASLNHWQQWYLEYSALQEEVESLPKEPPPRKELARIRRDFDSELITKKEINEIFGKNDLKDAQQIVSVLSRRIDYVEQNVNSLQKLLESAENKLSAATVVANPDGGTDEETGLPITDIIEELDDDDNIVKSTLRNGADTSINVAEALKKYGLDELPEKAGDLTKGQGAAPPTQETESTVETPKIATQSTDSSNPPSIPKEVRKSVSFADDTKPGHEDKASREPVSAAAHKVEALMQQAKEQEAIDLSSAVIPEGESAEDSALRREMLDYCMSEIGPVVAELQIEEGSIDSDDELDWEEIGEETEDDDDEDELGRSRRSVITADYIKRMQELEKRLQGQSHFAVQWSKPNSQTAGEGVGQVHVVPEQSSSSKSENPVAVSKEPKSVRFASTLDIAEEKAPQPPPKAKKPEKPLVNPVGDIVEKIVGLEPELLDEHDEPPKRVSRFKKDRAAGVPVPGSTASLPPGPLQIRPKFFNDPVAPVQPVEPAPPEGQTVVSAIVERSVVSEAREPDDMDDALLYQAAAVEYQRLRNKMIQQQGGFLKENESPTIPLEEEEGGPPRVSRFKAARLAKP